VSERLHLLTLILEMLGFLLAFIHVFRAEIAHGAIRGMHSVLDRWLSGFALNGADADKSAPLEQRDVLANGNTLIAILGMGSGLILFIWRFDIHAGFGSWVGGFFAAILTGGFVGFFAYVVLAIGMHMAVGLAEQAGKGNLIVGIGFALGSVGMAIESFQVWESSLRWSLAVLWGPALLLLTFKALRRWRSG
jgi:hypothetical protein